MKRISVLVFLLICALVAYFFELLGAPYNKVPVGAATLFTMFVAVVGFLYGRYNPKSWMLTPIILLPFVIYGFGKKGAFIIAYIPFAVSLAVSWLGRLSYYSAERTAKQGDECTKLGTETKPSSVTFNALVVIGFAIVLINISLPFKFEDSSLVDYISHLSAETEIRLVIQDINNKIALIGFGIFAVVTFILGCKVSEGSWKLIGFMCAIPLPKFFRYYQNGYLEIMSDYSASHIWSGLIICVIGLVFSVMGYWLTVAIKRLRSK